MFFPDGSGRRMGSGRGRGSVSGSAKRTAEVVVVEGMVTVIWDLFCFGWSSLETRESETKKGGEDRIKLRSKPSYLSS